CKTRLALHVAAELAFRQPALFSDGVHVAELAAVPSGEAVIPAIADTLGYSFSGAGDPKRQLLAQLQGQKLLLVLDNFEHLAAEAGLLTELLRAAPGMTLLVTSRGRLSLYEEWCFELRGLATPDQAAPEEAIEASSTVQLFVTRAPPPAPVRSRAGVGDHRPHLPAARGHPPGDRAGHAGQPAPRYPQPDE